MCALAEGNDGHFNLLIDGRTPVQAGDAVRLVRVLGRWSELWDGGQDAQRAWCDTHALSWDWLHKAHEARLEIERIMQGARGMTRDLLCVACVVGEGFRVGALGSAPGTARVRSQTQRAVLHARLPSVAKTACLVAFRKKTSRTLCSASQHSMQCASNDTKHAAT
jgi:hypothetical protein